MSPSLSLRLLSPTFGMASEHLDFIVFTLSFADRSISLAAQVRYKSRFYFAARLRALFRSRFLGLWSLVSFWPRVYTVGKGARGAATGSKIDPHGNPDIRICIFQAH